MAAQCDDIAGGLLIPHERIEAIKKDKESSCKDRLREYVKEWLKGNGGDRTWQFLGEVLRDKLVGRPDVADKLPK